MDDTQVLIARLLAERSIPRNDLLARRALTDDAFREELDRRLAQCGLRLLEHPYADYVAVALLREVEASVFGRKDQWQSNNAGITRDCAALLIVLWALIILPKRERQIGRRAKESADQHDMFGAEKPIPQGEVVSAGISEHTLRSDFGVKLGGKMRVNLNLGVLARLGFIQRRKQTILEGPLLDLALDYGTLAQRVLGGALEDLLAQRAATPAVNVVDDDGAREDAAQ